MNTHPIPEMEITDEFGYTKAIFTSPYSGAKVNINIKHVYKCGNQIRVLSDQYIYYELIELSDFK